MSSFRKNILGVKGAIAGFAGAAGLVSLVRNIQEAERAAGQLDTAFEATGRGLGLTRSRLDDLASEIQKTTIVSDDLAKEAQALLLTFDRVRGQAFERTIKVAADLSARLGTDLKGAVRQVGLALQDPERGLIGLRRAGISFSEAQRDVIKNLIETNQSAKAQELILSELERRFAGSARAARDTLGGALTGLKNSFGDLFEGTKESSSQAAAAINSLSESLSDPSIKESIDLMVTGLAKLVKLAVELLAVLGKIPKTLKDGASAIGQAASNLSKAAPLGRLALGNPFAATIGAQFALRGQATAGLVENEDERRAREEAAALARESSQAQVQAIEEFRVTVRQARSEIPDHLRAMSDATRTETERQVAAYEELKESLAALRSEGIITREQQLARQAEGLDQLLPEIDIEAIRKLYLPIRTQTTELGEFMKGVWQGVGQSIQGTLSDALFEWNVSWRSFVNIARRALADVVSAIITSGIKNALASQTKTSSSSGSSNTAGFLSFIGGLFGLSGGGRFDGPRIVGEDGPEVVTGTGRVFNQRQVAFAGAAANIVFSPVNNVSIIEREDPNQTKREMIEYFETRSAQQQGELVRLLARSGVEVKG